MANSIDTNYRDTYNDPYSSQRKTNKTEGQNLDMVFTDKAEQSLSTEDFLNLIVMQMQNQDFTNPMDNSQMLTQMAQFSTLQQMQELAAYSKSNYVTSLLGTTVTAAKFAVNGDVQKETGPVQKISLVNNEYAIYVNDQKFSLEQLMELHDSSPSDIPFDASSLNIEQQSVSARWAEIKWPVPTEDEDIASSLSYSVYYSESSEMSTVDDVLKNGKLAINSGGMTSTIVTGLEPDKTYYINVLVEDATGKKTCYKPLTVRTKISTDQAEGEA